LIKIFKIDNKSDDQRLDKYLKRKFSGLKQSFIEKNLRKKNILVNNKITKSNYIIKIDDQVKIKNFSEEVYPNFEKVKSKININKSLKQNFRNSVLYENENFLVLDKWSGIATQGGTNISISIDTIIKNISMQYNLVHRLDKETTGLLIIAKNLKYTKIFGQIFKSQKLKKTYLALCDGKPKLKESYVDLLINSKDKVKTIKTKTYYKVLLYNQKISLIKFEPKTGKKHQLRIVAKNLGCPIIGDLKYNLNKTKQKENLKLNAFKLQFVIEYDEFNFQSELPKDFVNYLKFKNIKFDFKTI
jgi:23S rRNA pseudouridine955/2504/2580 synthase